MEKPTCAGCQFFKPSLNGTAYGDCVRYPEPIVHTKDHWCGEFRAVNGTQFKEPAIQNKAKR